MELPKGFTLKGGKYTIEKGLGKGSFGITYLATMKVKVAESLGAIETTVPVAIKEFFMSDLNSRSAEGSLVEGSQNTLVANYRRKFRNEAQNLGRMSHPNIVKVLEVWDENNTTYYSMEYVDGVSLDDYIREKGPIPEDKAIKMFSQLADAVQYMHSKHMLHLDIKPKNVMIRKEASESAGVAPAYQLLLIDFGLSKQYDANGDPESSTRVGGGTPGYAPIEQADFHDGKEFPVTMDIYALGATLFKMLTGQTPPTASSLFNNGFPIDMLKKNNISQNTIDVVKKAMSPSKRDRFQLVKEIDINTVHIEKAQEKNKKNDENENTILDNNNRTITSTKTNSQKILNNNTDISFKHVLKNNWIFLTISVTTLILYFVSWCIKSLNNGISALCVMGLCIITDVWAWIGYIWFLALIFFIIWSFIKRYHSFWKTITKHKWLKIYFFTSTIVVFLGILVLLVNNSTVVGYSWDDQGGAIVGTPVYKGLLW